MRRCLIRLRFARYVSILVGMMAFLAMGDSRIAALMAGAAFGAMRFLYHSKKLAEV